MTENYGFQLAAQLADTYGVQVDTRVEAWSGKGACPDRAPAPALALQPRRTLRTPLRGGGMGVG